MTREDQLAEAFVEVADTLADDFDVIDFLHGLAERCVRLLDVDAAGLMLADAGGKLHATATSSEKAHLLESFQVQTGAGPCVDSFRTGAQVVNVDLHANAGRWPRFAEAADATGFAAVHALPLRLRGTVIGALNLFSTGSRVLSAADVRTGQALADVATIGILAQRGVHQAELLAAQLQAALDSRVLIEQAKGVLAERRQITADAAFALLRSHARSNNLRLSDLARDVAEGSAAVAALFHRPTTQAASAAGQSTAAAAIEGARLAAVRRYAILDTPPDGAFDRVAALATRIFQVPIASVTIVDSDRVWFKATQGLPAGLQEIPRAPGLCASVVLRDGPEAVPDARGVPDLADHPVIRDLGVGCYAGAPIVTVDGHRLGTVNIMDTEPRTFSATELAILTDLAAVVMDELELRLAALHAVRLESELRQRAETETARLTSLSTAQQR